MRWATVAIWCAACAAIGGCGSRGAKRPPETTRAAPDAGVRAAGDALAAAATSERPRPGHATLSLTGAVTATVAGDGVACQHAGFTIGTAELGLTGATPPWTLNLYQAHVGQWHAGLVVGAQPATPALYEWAGAGGAPALTPRPGAATLDLTLQRRGGGTVRVRGDLTCATYPTAPVPPPITALLAEVTSAPVRMFATFDFGRARDPAAASAIVSTGAADMVRRLRRELPAGWIAFLGTDQFLGDERPAPGSVEVVVARGVAPFDILRVARTDATNYDLQTEALVHALTAWDSAWGIDIEHATTDTIELSVRRMPSDLPAFAREVYALCPDVVDQGTGTVEALAAEIGARRRVVLWWD